MHFFSKIYFSAPIIALVSFFCSASYATHETANRIVNLDINVKDNWGFQQHFPHYEVKVYAVPNNASAECVTEHIPGGTYTTMVINGEIACDTSDLAIKNGKITGSIQNCPGLDPSTTISAYDVVLISYEFYRDGSRNINTLDYVLVPNNSEDLQKFAVNSFSTSISDTIWGHMTQNHASFADEFKKALLPGGVKEAYFPYNSQGQNEGSSHTYTSYQETNSIPSEVNFAQFQKDATLFRNQHGQGEICGVVFP